MTVRDMCLTAIIIVAITIVVLMIGPIAQEKCMDCTYCGIPVQLRADPPLQNHWHDGDNIICDDCWKAGRR